MESKRLPGKPLLDVGGKPLIQHTYENCAATGIKTFVVTDSFEIASIAANISANHVVTDPANTGTERCMLAANQLGLKDDDIIINCQVDYPNIPVERILHLVDCIEDVSIYCYSLYYQRSSCIRDRNDVKVALNSNNEALYFSRENIPYKAPFLNIHIGIYCYTYRYLKIAHLFPSNPQFTGENLEQLQWLDNGRIIKLLPIIDTYKIFAINTQRDLYALKLYHSNL